MIRVKERRRRRSAGLVLLRPADLGPHIIFFPEIRDAEAVRSIGNKMLHSLSGEETERC